MNEITPEWHEYPLASTFDQAYDDKAAELNEPLTSLERHILCVQAGVEAVLVAVEQREERKNRAGEFL